MTQPPHPEPIPTAQGDINVRQTVEGDRNQAIGQVLGGIVVYVSGGQAVFHSGSTESDSSVSKPTSSAIGPNPFKGLMAFQETDGDRFFGREKQIAALWEKLRSLHETESAIRVLPIYGPSGSGKSSLARAGLIPELARHSIPGYDRARVAVLVPGTHPLESLATVLARIATQDLTPVAKTREFAGELKQVNEIGEYDGLRRIADVISDIAIAPLVVLVDQFEEVYTLCKDTTEREAFVGNLLNAAGDRSRRVMVIVTLRSDFLGETHKHAVLNRLFSEQGYLVPAMSLEELRQAIAKPAELAGHPLDAGTIDLLVKDTEGREGALPLLQFALTRIWEELAEGKQPAETLKAIGGVGGALAGEAQRIYDSLDEEGRAITRRLFLGLVQLGEGTKDTRRRALLDGLVSYQDQPDQVKQVINLFAAPGTRLITLSANGTTETAEVTHEALFDHWKQLQVWLEGSRSDIRFHRRLDEAARYWNEQGRLEGDLWRPPNLDLLRQYHQQAGVDMSPLQIQFFKASNRSDWFRKRRRQLGVGGLVAGLIFTVYQLQQTQRQRVEQLAITSKALLLSEPVNAVANAINAVGLGRSAFVQFPNHSVSISARDSLLKAIQINREQNKLSHDDIVYSVALSPDNTVIVSSSGNTAISLWNAKTGQRIGQPVYGHDISTNTVAFSPDGQMIVSGGSDNMVRLWQVNLGADFPIQELGVFPHGDVVTSVAFSPNGRTIASGSWDDDSRVRLWNTETKRPIGQPLRGHEKQVYSTAFSPDSKIVVSGSADKTIRLWDARTGQSIGQPLVGHEDSVNSVAFSPDGRTIASGSADKTIRLWDARTRQPIGQPLVGHEDSVNSVAFSSDGKTIVSSGADKTIRLWDARTGQPIGQPLVGHENWVYTVAFSLDGRTIVSGGADKMVRLWNVRASQQIRKLLRYSEEVPIGQPLIGHKDGITSVALSPDGRTIASSSWDRTVQLWNAQTGQWISQLSSEQEDGKQKDGVSSVAFSPDGRTIVSGGWDWYLRLWDVKTGQLLVKPPLFQHQDEVSSVAFSPDGRTIASGSWDATVRLWDAKTGQPIWQTLNGHRDEVFAVAFSPDGHSIVSGSRDTTVRSWDAKTGQPIWQTPNRDEDTDGHKDTVEMVAFSPDGTMIASGSADKTIRLWNAKTGEPIGQPLRGHEDAITSIAFSPDGTMIASGSADKTIRLWNAKTRKPIGEPLRGHENSVTSVVFASNSKTIISGSADKTVRFWPIIWANSLDMLLEIACEQLRFHSSLTNPTTPVGEEAKQNCDRYVWSE